MRCPACYTPAYEHDAACRQCGLTLDGLAQSLGIPPLLETPIADVARLLSRSEHRSALTAIRELHQGFPQLSFAAVIMDLPPEIPPSLQAFWLFNRGSLFSAVEKGGDNHGILYLQDSAQRRGVAMVGYGLEPFISEILLESCLTAASGSLAKSRHGAAIEAFVRELERQLRDVLAHLPRTFGLVEPQRWQASFAGASDEMDPVSVDEDVY